MLPLFAVMLPVIIMFCGLSIDVGLLELKKLQMQTAADAAALGAELDWERGQGNEGSQGKADAAANGFTDGVNGVTVSITNPPWSGDYSSRTDTQYVTITQAVRTIFMGALNGGKSTVSVSAVVLEPPCGYFTNTAGISNAYTLNITNNLSVPNQGMFSRCPLYVAKNIYLASNLALFEHALNATGTAGQSSLLGPSNSPAYNALTVADPLAGVTQPTLGACNHISFTVATSAWTVINPGNYCGTIGTPGMKLIGANVSFNPGVYVITGGFHATGTSLFGSGVTLFFTKSGTTPYGQVIFDGVTQVYLAPPTSGALVNIVLFTDRNWVHTAAQDVQFNDSNFNGSGIWYVTGSGVQLTAKASTWSSTFISVVTDSLYVESSTLNLFGDFSTVNTGNPFRTRAVLVQ